MSFPLRWTVQRLPYLAGATDSHGNPVDSWGDPVDVKVYGWGAPTTDEPPLAGHDRVVVDLLVYGPGSMPFTSMDRAVVESKTYEVVGEVDDYDHGPFGWQPGATVSLRRVEG